MYQILLTVGITVACLIGLPNFVLNIFMNIVSKDMLNLVDNRLPQYSVLMIGLVAMNWTLYGILDWILTYTSKAYPSLEYGQKRYVVKNLSKSGILLLLLVSVLPALYQMMIHDTWDNLLLRTVGTVYASTDLTGLLFVPDLSTATKIHHVCVMIICTTNILMDYTQEGLHRGFISLTILSMIPYLVNTYLGMRHLEGKKMKRWILKICLWLYSVSVIINCILQHAYVLVLVPGFSLERCITKTLYMMLYYFILYDDVKLIKYLNYKYQEILTDVVKTVDTINQQKDANAPHDESYVTHDTDADSTYDESYGTNDESMSGSATDDDNNNDDNSNDNSDEGSDKDDNTDTNKIIDNTDANNDTESEDSNASSANLSD